MALSVTGTVEPADVDLSGHLRAYYRFLVVGLVQHDFLLGYMTFRSRFSSTDGKDLPSRVFGDQAPDTRRSEQHDKDRDCPENDQIERAKAGKERAEHEEYDCTDERSFEPTTAADHDDEKNVCRPIQHTERGIRLHAQFHQEDECTNQSGRECHTDVDAAFDLQ